MKKLLPVAMAVAVLAGCSTTHSEAPLASNFATSKQTKLQAANHWLLIAKDVADQIRIGTEKVGAPVFVTPPQHNSKFTQAFYTQIITSLVNQGVTVRKYNDGTAQVIDIDTQLLKFSPNRHQNKRFISTSAISAGVMAIHGLDFPVKTDAVLAGLAVTGAYDWLRWIDQEYASGATPQYELIVTTSLVKNSQFIARRTDAYYIADSDWTMYNKESDYTFRVVGGQ